MNALPRLDAAIMPLAQPQTLLRFLTCGSVDDGKSTLIGRLLYECGAVLDDQLGALDRDSRRFGTQGEALDFALLVDGLAAEREQGITIDVAYRYFATPRRKFIVADTPGHEQYTRNMATGASTADLAILLVDARKGLLTQTRRHAYIASRLRVRHVVLAVNKMDMVGFDEGVFAAIVRDFSAISGGLGFASVTPIPLSARDGDNVVLRSERTPWHVGPTLLEHLETVESDDATPRHEGFVLPVQWVNRPDLDFRGYAGTIAAGRVRVGERVTTLPRGQASRVARIVTYDGDLDEAFAGQAVTLTLADEIDVSRGDALVAKGSLAQVADTLSGYVFWAAEAPLRAGQRYWLKLAAGEASAEVVALHHAVDVHAYRPVEAESLAMNGVGAVSLRLDRPLVHAEYAESRALGGFILIDRFTNETAAIGMVDGAAKPAQAAAARPWVARVLEARFGVAGTQRRGEAMRALTSDAAGAGVVALAAGVATGSGAVALLFGAGDVLLRPVLREAVAALWRRFERRAEDYDSDGSGI